jgi:hypothetical protein
MLEAFRCILVLTYLLHGAESFLRSYLVLQLVKKVFWFYTHYISIRTTSLHHKLTFIQNLHSYENIKIRDPLTTTHSIANVSLYVT